MYNLMVGSEGELVRTPFDKLPLDKWPSDFCSVLYTRKHLDYVEREIFMIGEKYPKPTWRTKFSTQGFQEWKIWVEALEEKKRKQPAPKEGEPPRPKETWEIFTPGHVVVWDYMSPQNVMYEDISTGRLVTKEDIKTNQGSPFMSSGKRRSD